MAINTGALNPAAWRDELAHDDPMHDFILDGVLNGFNIVDISKASSKCVEIDNYQSALSEENFSKVEAQIVCEMENGRYRVVRAKPRIVSALGALSKSDGGVRLIHDASRPEGASLNDMWDKEKFCYQTIENAVRLISPGCYLAKLDLASAYRSVGIHHSNFPYTGLKWTFSGDAAPTYMVDTALPFGSRRSPYVFHQLGQAVIRMMAKRGYHGIVVFLDDFLIIEDSQERCAKALNVLMGLLRYLGFSINYKKIEMPCNRLSFLGIILDTHKMILELPFEKIVDLEKCLKALISSNRTTKRQLQILTGKLNFACSCIYGGRFFLRRLFDAVAKLKKPWHRMRVNKDMRADAVWWLTFLRQFNGTMPMIDPRPLKPIYTDSSSFAAGGVYGLEFVHIPWEVISDHSSLHINFKEAIAIELTLAYFAPVLANHTVLVHCDNQAAVAMVNSGTSRNPIVMQHLRNIFWLSALYNFRLKVCYVKGVDNVLADVASRLHEANIVHKRGLRYDVICDLQIAGGSNGCSGKSSDSSRMHMLQIPGGPTTVTGAPSSNSAMSIISGRFQSQPMPYANMRHT